MLDELSSQRHNLLQIAPSLSLVCTHSNRLSESVAETNHSIDEVSGTLSVCPALVHRAGSGFLSWGSWQK